MSYAVARRSFLAAVGASTLGHLLRSAEARAAGQRPLRFMAIHYPLGAIREQWLPGGAGRSFTLGQVWTPFEPHKASMVVFDGLANAKGGGSGGGHEGGILLAMGAGPSPGVYPGTNSDFRNGGPSIDQLLLAKSAVLQGTPFPSLQLGVDNRADRNEGSSRVMSYPAPDTRLFPELSPLRVYTRLFGALQVGGGTPATAQALQRARARKQSVLDFVRRDLARLQMLVPAGERDKIDAHAAAIRDVEATFDSAFSRLAGGGDAASCGNVSAPPDLPVNSSDLHGMIGALHLALVRAAFACDLTRVVTFLWSPGSNHVVFKLPGLPTVSHHAQSHHEMDSPTDMKVSAAIRQWYAQRTADFLADLKRTADPAGGTLLDSTLIAYVTDVSAGWSHSYANMPVALFGGAGVRLAGGQFLQFPGRPQNDMWLAVAPAFGVTLPALGDKDMSTGPLPGVLA